MGYFISNEPFDWTPCYPNIYNPILDEPTVFDNEDERYRIRYEHDSGENTYFGWDIDIWNLHGNRDKDVTLPSKQEEEFDRCIPHIVEVHDDG
ncbi:hypothetical protein BD410DRAFT_785708 [Rickenella mellea]|uniref:Uncharacterized protein n=1 Tax=Rickenella mellea TaxID=50990 RepID=A0A4Y7QCH2_9AGAM|nr:hypothetical protein BD410DRAFT_785708 [Rickenella mellea]